MIASPGLLLFDNSCLKFLRNDKTLRLVRGSCRATGLDPVVSEINVLEALQTPSQGARRTLLSILASIAEGRPVLPIPEAILRLEGSLEQGTRDFAEAALACGAYLRDPERATDEVADRARKVLAEPAAAFEEHMTASRERVRKFILANGLEGSWYDGKEFLDSSWNTDGHLTEHLTGLWPRLGLPGTPDPERVLKNPAWRLYLEGIGVAAWERNFLKKQPRPAHLYDLRQLVYLATEANSVLVSDDIGMVRAGDLVVRGRHAGSIVKSWEDYSASLS